MIILTELVFIWFIYFAYGAASQHDMPVWLTALLVIIVDRTVTFITSLAKRRRTRLQE